MRSRPETFLESVAPYRDDLVVAVECMFTGYWLADLCHARIQLDCEPDVLMDE